jgi:endonuclease/exonuclease/phosphatase family metal-dependent hydrolase
MTELPYTQTKDCIRVCSYNVGLWNDGVNAGVPTAEVATKTNAWRRFIGANDPDFMFLEEAREYFDASNTKKASSQIFSNNYPKWFWLNTAKMLGIASKYNANDIEMVSTGTFSDRPYVKFWADINGKKVNFILCHLSLEANSSGARQDQMSELATLLGTYEYGVLCGDFNAYSTSEFDTHFSAFNMANHGWFGDYATWPHATASWPNECIDNIITTKNITIRNVELGTEELSDHMPLFAELDIY